MINVPLAAKTNGAVFRKAIETEFLPALQFFKPDMLFISAGFDAHLEDPLADLGLIEDDYAWISQYFTDFAAKNCQSRLVSVLEGGYNLHNLSSSVLAFLKPLSHS